MRPTERSRTAAFVAALLILAIGTVGILVPSALVGLARHTLTATAFYGIGAVRVALGLLLVAAARSSRAPTALRVLGYVILAAGIATALTGLLAMERARALIEWWLHRGTGPVRLAGAAVVTLGGFIAWACAPARRPG